MHSMQLEALARWLDPRPFCCSIAAQSNGSPEVGRQYRELGRGTMGSMGADRRVIQMLRTLGD